MTPLDVLAQVVAILGSGKGGDLVDAYTLGATQADASGFISELLENFGEGDGSRVELVIEQSEPDGVALLDYALCVLGGEERKISSPVVLPTDRALLGAESC